MPTTVLDKPAEPIIPKPPAEAARTTAPAVPVAQPLDLPSITPPLTRAAESPRGTARPAEPAKIVDDDTSLTTSSIVFSRAPARSEPAATTLDSDQTLMLLAGIAAFLFVGGVLQSSMARRRAQKAFADYKAVVRSKATT